jgi:hypothetical protein
MTSRSSSSFWGSDPDVWQWPYKTMSPDQKLNAITRLIWVLTLVGWGLTQRLSLLLVGLATIAGLYGLRASRWWGGPTEGFRPGPSSPPSPRASPTPAPPPLFQPVSRTNPFGNVLLTDIADHPDRPPAPPSFDPHVRESIDEAVRRQTQRLHPTCSGLSTALYGDLSGKVEMDRSMQRFYSTANSRVTNDQGAFGQYLYGNMPSGKEDTPEAAQARAAHAERHVQR